MVKDNLKIGTLVVSIPPAPAGTPVDCRFTYDSNGVLEVIVTDQQGRNNQLIIESSSEKLSEEQIQKSLKKLEKLKIHPRDRAENRLLLARLERMYAESLGKQRVAVQEILLHFRSVLEKQDERLTIREAAKVNRQLNEWEESTWL